MPDYLGTRANPKGTAHYLVSCGETQLGKFVRTHNPLQASSNGELEVSCQTFGQRLSLVVSALPVAPPMQWNWDDQSVRGQAAEDIPPGLDK